MSSSSSVFKSASRPAFVDVAPVTDSNNGDPLCSVVNDIDDAILTDHQPPVPLPVTPHPERAGRTWIGAQRIGLGPNPVASSPR